MRFKVGQVYQCTDDGRRAVVTQVRSDDREGLLRFGDNSAEEWFLWAELRQAGKSHLIGGPGLLVYHGCVVSAKRSFPIPGLR